jgi:hypothetical protein
VDPVHHRTTEIGPSLREQVDPIGHSLPLRVGQHRPPLDELIGDFDFPHPTVMSNDSS